MQTIGQAHRAVAEAMHVRQGQVRSIKRAEDRSSAFRAQIDG